MSRLLEQVREAVRTRHYSIRTEEAYIRWVRQYILFCGERRPSEPGAREVSAFVSHLAVGRWASASNQTRFLSALPFLRARSLRERVFLHFFRNLDARF